MLTKKQAHERGIWHPGRTKKGWSGVQTPLMKVGFAVFSRERVPRRLLEACADYCATRAAAMAARGNSRGRSGAGYYDWWRRKCVQLMEEQGT